MCFLYLFCFSQVGILVKFPLGIPHLTRVGSFEVDASLEGSIILCRQVNQPGMIGTVGSILGEENVNVSFMSVGRIAPGKQAVMAIGVDDQPSKEALKKIGEVSAIEECFSQVVVWITITASFFFLFGWLVLVITVSSR